MYIKGISKVLIVITILVSLFLVIPSNVEAAEFDAKVICQTDYKVVSGGFGIKDVCCPTASYFSNKIKASNPTVIKSVTIKGAISITIPFPGNLDCRATYDAVRNDNTSVANQTIDLDSQPAEYGCPVNYCKIVRTEGTKCLTQKTIAYKDTDIVCCISKKGTPGTLISLKSCVPDEEVSAEQFNQAPKEITADEICSRDSGAGNADDKRSSAEKGRIYGECMACLQKSNYLWTGVGCMEASLNGVITTVIRIFYGIITALMLIKIIIAGYKYYGGDPEQLKDSKMEIFSAIGAAFALTLGLIALRYIGIDILGLGNIDGISLLPILK